MSDIEIRSVAYLREIATGHPDAADDPTCIAAAWAADEIEKLREVVHAFCDVFHVEAKYIEQRESGG